MIQLHKDGAIWRLTLDRPDKANSLTQDMLEEILQIVQTAQTAQALILTGAGKTFSAGADLDQAALGLATSDIWERVSSAIADLPALTIAALNGTLAGGAFGMALACDLRLAVPEAKFFYPVMERGFLPQPSDPERLRALIGPARSKLILMAGHKMTATDALNAGLIDQICAKDTLIAAAYRMTEKVSKAQASHVAAIQAMCNASRGTL